MHLQSPLLHIVLYQPEIPGNTGAVGRTCVALGAKLWLVRPLGFRIDEKSLRRAGLDYWTHLDWEIVDHWEMLSERLAGHRFWFLSRFATRSLYGAHFERGDVIVFGGETQGLPRSLVLDNADTALRIPTTDKVRSLNLSNSVAVCAFEAARQLVDTTILNLQVE